MGSSAQCSLPRRDSDHWPGSILSSKGLPGIPGPERPFCSSLEPCVWCRLQLKFRLQRTVFSVYLLPVGEVPFLIFIFKLSNEKWDLRNGFVE